ncbi:MAG: hypothetical protein K6G00_02925 [Treponema sp.]|nr:hypothetical protein [Treponema sp.]
MNFITLALAVLKTPQVIFITVLMIFFISLGNYVVKYKKRKKLIVKKAAPAPKPEKKEEPKEEGEGEESSSEG